MAKRAITDQDKNLKKEKIILSALELLELGQFPFPSVNQICEKSNEAKGTVYLYFSSKEEIYLNALELYFKDFEAKMLKNLIQHKKISDGLGKTFIDFARENPKIIYISSITPLVLESNISPDFVLKFKTGMWELVKHVVNIIQSKKPLNFNETKNNFLVSYTLFLSMWQHLNANEEIMKIMEQGNLQGLHYPFEKTLVSTLNKIWEEYK